MRERKGVARCARLKMTQVPKTDGITKSGILSHRLAFSMRTSLSESRKCCMRMIHADMYGKKPETRTRARRRRCLSKPVKDFKGGQARPGARTENVWDHARGPSASPLGRVPIQNA